MDAKQVVAIHSMRGSGRGNIPLPPFNAGSLRMTTIFHTNEYRKLWRKKKGRNSQVSFLEKRIEENLQGPLSDEAGANEQSLAQGLLLTDLMRIVQAVSYLEKTLWHIFIKVSGLYAALLLSNYFLFSNTLLYLTYPVAFGHIGQKGYDLWRTSLLRKAAKKMYQKIKSGTEINEEDMEWISRKNWDGIPWREIEPKFV